MVSRAAALLVTLLAYCFDVCGCEYSSAALAGHLDVLLAEYDREEAPPPRLQVALALDVRHAAVDDAGATMRLLADLKMSWIDIRLVWNASQWEGDSVLVSAERLWTPDVELASAGQARGGGGGGVLRARLRASGAVTHVLRLDLAVPVPLRLARWPQDTQQADFKFASRSHTSDELQLKINEYKGSVVVECGAWEVQSVSGVAEGGAGEEGAATASWVVVARRRGAAQALAQGTVLAAATLLLAAAAARPYSQRMPLAAAASLVAALWLITVMFCVPASASTPRIVWLMCGVCWLGASAGAGAALAGALAARTAPPPPALRALLSKLSAIHTITPDPECVRGAGGGAGGGAWAAAAHLLDALLAVLTALALLVLLLVYWID